MMPPRPRSGTALCRLVLLPLVVGWLGLAAASGASASTPANTATAATPDQPAPAPAPVPANAAPKRLLLVTVTTGYRHASIPTAARVLQRLADSSGGAFEIAAHAEQPTLPYPKNDDKSPAAEAARAAEAAAVRDALAPLAPDALRASRIDGVIFASTTGDLPLPDTEGFLKWIADGHAFIGMHAATDTLAGHEGYCSMVGGTFDGHPWHEEVTIRVEEPRHPAAGDYREPFVLKDEIYQFKKWSRSDVGVILSLDPSNASRPAAPGKPGFFERGKRADRDYALAWVREPGAGRVFYTALGHGDEVWNDPAFQAHLRGGIAWAVKADDKTNDRHALAGSEP